MVDIIIRPKNWDKTTHNPKTKKWLLLTTNIHSYNDIYELDDNK